MYTSNTKKLFDAFLNINLSRCTSNETNTNSLTHVSNAKEYYVLVIGPTNIHKLNIMYNDICQR